MNIVEYDEIRAALSETKDKCNYIPDASTKEGYEASKATYKEVRKIEIRLESKRKEKKKFFIDGGKEVDLQAKAIQAELESARNPHKIAFEAVDKEKKAREEERKKGFTDRIEFMLGLAESMRECDSEQIMLARNDMQNEECLDFFEFTEEALKARNKARSDLYDLYVKVSEKEKLEKEVAKLKAEAEERERNGREEIIRKSAEKEAEEKVEKLRLDAEQEKERKAKDVEHVSNILRAAKESIMTYVDEQTAKKIVLAIKNNEVPNVRIEY